MIQGGDCSDDESTPTARTAKSKTDGVGREELDVSNLIGTEEASKRFRKAEKKHGSSPYSFYSDVPV